MPHETNEQFIKRIMTHGCPTGSLVRVFVIGALERFSDDVIKAGPEKCDSAILDGEAWVKTAEFVRAEIKKTYGH